MMVFGRMKGGMRMVWSCGVGLGSVFLLIFFLFYSGTPTRHLVEWCGVVSHV